MHHHIFAPFLQTVYAIEKFKSATLGGVEYINNIKHDKG